MTLAELNGANALTIVGTISKLLRQLERELPEHKGLAKKYADEAMSGDYDHLCKVSEDYAVKYLASTLSAREGDLTA